MFLWRYGDNFLYEMTLGIILTDCRKDIALIYGTMDYIFTDWLIGRAGKYSTLLGLAWEIERLAGLINCRRCRYLTTPGGCFDACRGCADNRVALQAACAYETGA